MASYIGGKEQAVMRHWFIRSLLSAVIAVTAVSPGAAAPVELQHTIYKLFGQPNTRETMINRIVPNACFHAGGVVVDTSSTPNKIYILDSGNNRILGFNGFKAAPAPADIVIGQPSLTDSGSANGNNTIYALPTASTLAILGFPDVNSTLEAPRAIHMSCDSSGNLYVVDLSNNRILKYNDPFNTDTIADDVWGQTDFITRARPVNVNSRTLSLDFVGQQVFCAGVDIDSSGNLWVADSGNNRVLRFPPGSKSADLVLGQGDFYTTTSKPYVLNPPLNRMTRPVAVKVHPTTGEVYVLEGEQPPTNRVLVFRPPFRNGGGANRAFGAANDWLAVNQVPEPEEAADYMQIGFDSAHWWVRISSGLRWARGFAFDPINPERVWIGDGGNRRILQFNSTTGAMTDVLGFSSFYGHGDATTPIRMPDGTLNPLGQVDGSFGVDASNLYVPQCVNGAWNFRGIQRIPLPILRDSTGHVICDGLLLNGGWNKIDPRTATNPFGMSSDGNQLFVSDGQRIIVWNQPADKPTYSPGDYFMGQESGETNNNTLGLFRHGIGQTSIKNGYLFTINGDISIKIFQLPITASEYNPEPVKTLRPNNGSVRWADDNTSVNFWPNCAVYDSVNDALWVGDYVRNRVLRIANPLGTPVVDLVLGQPNKSASEDNAGAGYHNPNAWGFENIWAMNLDNFGNLYVVDSGYEGREDSGNLRVTRFDAATLVPQPGNIFPLPAATGVFCKINFTVRDNTITNIGGTGMPATPIYVAFNSKNEMLLTVCSYGNAQGQRIFLYPTPHIGTTPYPTYVIKPFMGQGAFASFLTDTDVMVQDHTWNRVLFLHLGLKGDVNGDGSLSTTDLTLAMRIAAGLETATPAMITRGALTGQGTITLEDVVALRKILP